MGAGRGSAQADWGSDEGGDLLQKGAARAMRAAQVLRRAGGLAVLGCAEATRAGGAPPASSEHTATREDKQRDASIIAWLEGSDQSSEDGSSSSSSSNATSTPNLDSVDEQLLRAADLADAGDVGPAAAQVIRALMRCSMAAAEH